MEMSSVSREIDVFETEGSENTVGNFEDDRNSSAVEKVDIGFQTSFGIFKTKQLQPSTTNFSDSISRSIQYGFKTELNDYELEGCHSNNETLMQRYQRLKLEVTELINEVDQLEKSESQLSGANPADVISDLQQLQSCLSQVELDRVLVESSVLTGSESAPHTVLFKQLQAQLSAAKAPPTDETSGGHVYEVYGNVEASKFGHLSKLSDLEMRLATLEGLVGKTDSSKVSVVAAGLDADYKDISSAVLGLQSKVALLDGAHVSAITGQLNELLTMLQKVSNNKNKEIDTEHMTKVTEALETVTTIAPLISVVPDVVNRLHTLKDLHEHASQLVNTISSISGEQDRISEQLKQLKTLLDQVQSNVNGSMNTLETNFTSLETRISALKQK